jgi:membrane associated rhomboid family serine protease
MSGQRPEDHPKYKAVYWWAKLIGQSDTQAAWRARQSLEESVEQKRVTKHFHCVCGQLLLIGTAQCGACHRKQYAPAMYHRGLKELEVGSGYFSIGVMTFLCLLMYGVQVALSGDFISGAPPREIDPLFFLKLGAVHPFVPTDQYWRLFTYTLLHGGVMHIGFNLMALYQIGPLIEKSFGPARVLFFWVVSGALAVSLPALIQGGMRPTIGASGSVFGLIGVAMAYGHRIKTAHGLFIRNKMIEWTIICTLFGMMMGGVAHSAHFGGLIAGIGLSYLCPPPNTPSLKRLSPFMALTALAVMGWSLYMVSMSIYKYYMM